MDLPTLVPGYSETGAQSQIYLLQQPSGQLMGGQLQMPVQGAGDYTFLTSDFINIGGQTIQLQLPSNLQLPIGMLTSGQLLANGIQLLDSADVQQAQYLLAGSSEVRQDELATGADLTTSEQDAREDVVNPATVLLQLATEKATARAKKIGTPTCSMCGAQFVKWCQLNRHYRLHEEDKPFHCPHCPSMFNVELNLRLHEATHNADEPVCPECGKKFSRLAGLKAHILLHEKEETMICGECGDEFNTQIQLERHVGEEHGSNEQKVYSCRSCDEQFTRLAKFREHIKQVHRALCKPQVAPRKNKKRLDRTGFHQRCKHCNKTFQKPSQLERHVRIHTGEKPYVCETCGKAFNQKGAMLIHMTKHTGSRPYMCEHCPQCFSQKGNLRAHIVRVHSESAAEGEDNRKFRCDDCSCSFRKLGSLNAHISRVHFSTVLINEDNQGDAASYDQSQTVPVSVEPRKSSKVSQVHAGVKSVGVNGDILKQALENSGVAVLASGEVDMVGETVAANTGEGEGEDFAAAEAAAAAGTELTPEAEAKSVPRPIATIQTQPVNSLSNSNSIMLMAVRDTATGTVRRHVLRKVNGVKWHQCTYCGKEFKKPSDLVRHVRTHTMERPFRCRQCFRTFTVKSTLNAHIRMHSGLKEFRCLVCQKFFSTQGSMRVHLRLHTGAKPFTCEHCTKNFRTSGHLKSHLQSHVKEGQGRRGRKMAMINALAESQLPEVTLQEPIIITDGGFIQQPTQAVRGVPSMKVEGEGGRPYKCRFCSRGFKKSSHVKQHERSHTGEKPYQCLQCMKSFVSSGVLKAHLRIHSGARNFLCTICNCTFTTNGSLRRHLTTHTDSRPFMCPYCQHTFKTVVNCKKHMRIHRHEIAMQLQQSHELVLGDEGVDGDMLQPADLAPEDGTLALTAEDDHEPMVLSAQDFIALGQVVGGLGQENDGILTADGQLTSVNPQQMFLPGGIATTVAGHMTTDSIDQLVDPSLSSLPQVSYQPQTDEELKLASAVQPSEILTSTNMHNILPSKASSRRGEQVTPVEQHQLVIKPEVPTLRRSARCTICYKSFKKLTYLKQHMRNHAQMDTYSCNLCKMAFMTSAELLKHMRCHTGLRQYTCNRCQATFSTMSTLSRHTMTHLAAASSFECQACGSVLLSEAALEQHTCAPLLDTADETSGTDLMDKSAGGSKDYVQLTEEQTDLLSGILPDNSLTVSERLLIETAIEKNRVNEVKDRAYAAMHWPTFNNKCDYCPKSFRKPSDLARHLRTHTGERPYRCGECGRTFTVKSTLDCHLRTHLPDERSMFACHICGSPFSTKGTLKVHMRLHTGAKPFKCPHCDMRFRTSGHRKGHIQQHFKEAPARSRRTRAVPPQDNAEVRGQPADTAKQNTGEGAVQLLATDSDLLTGEQPLLPISLTLTDAFGADVGGSVAQLLEGMQLQIGGQGYQITGIESSLGSQPIQLDASFLQHLTNSVSVAINANLLSSSQAMDLLTSGNMTTSTDALGGSSETSGLQSHDVSDTGLKSDSEMTTLHTVRGDVTGVTEDEDDDELANKLTDTEDTLLHDVPPPVAIQSYCQACLQFFTSTEEQRLHVCEAVSRGKVFALNHQATTSARAGAPAARRQEVASTARTSQRAGTQRDAKQMHSCSVCGKEFAKPSQLVRHVRIHTGERPFVCTVCNKAFNQKNALQIHEKKHSGDRPFKCDYCQLAFCQKGNLRTHVKRVHQQVTDDVHVEPRRGLGSSSAQVTVGSSREARQVSVLLQRDAPRLRVDSMSGLLTSADDECMDDVGGSRDDDTHLPHLDDNDDDLDESFLTE